MLFQRSFLEKNFEIPQVLCGVGGVNFVNWSRANSLAAHLGWILTALIVGVTGVSSLIT